jgi:iron complex outermembrane recepter protein
VFQPTWSWANGLCASIDYYKIELNEVIAPASDVLRRCFEGLNEYCKLIEFDNSPFGIRRVLNRPLNQAALNTNGVDIEVAYRVPLEAMSIPGRLDLRVLANWTDDLERIDRAGTTITTVDFAGSSQSGGKSEWTGTINLNYSVNDFSAGLQARLFSELMYDVRRKAPGDEGYDPADVNSINDNKFPSVPYFTLNLAQGFTLNGHKMQAFAVVNNLMDRQAPVLSIAALNSGGNPYDYVGRTYKLGLRFNW